MAIPLSATSVYFLENVPFRSDYQHTRYFTNRAAQLGYFSNLSKSHTMTQASYQRVDGRHFVMVNKHIDSLWQTNYMMFNNSSYTNKWFYCFVTEMEYVNKGTTKVYFEVDVYQTWYLDTTFQQSYVVREHCPQYNSDGTPVINTVEEGLDYGSEYDVVSFEQFKPSNGLHFLVIVAKSLIHSNAAGEDVAKEIKPSLNGQPQPLSFYVHPFLADGSSPTTNFNLSPVMKVLKGIYENDDAVNNVVSLYITDNIGMDLEYEPGTQVDFPEANFRGISVADDQTESFSTIYCHTLPAYSTITETVDSNKYSGFNSVSESKLLMYPYTVLTLDDMKGNRQDFKIEYVNGKSIRLDIRGSLGISNKVTYSLPDYNTGDLASNDKSKSAYEWAVQGNSPNDVPILNDYLSAYMQGNRNSLQTQRQSIEFNGAMSAAGNLGSIATGNIAGGAMSLASGLGNTVLALQGMDSKIKDINNTPPSLGKMGSNSYWDFGHGYEGLFIIKKQIKAEYRRKLESFFKMYGYKVGRLKIPNMNTRSNWNYVQTQGCILKGTLPQDDLVRLQKVFDDGITLWHTDNIGNYSLENGE